MTPERSEVILSDLSSSIDNHRRIVRAVDQVCMRTAERLLQQTPRFCELDVGLWAMIRNKYSVRVSRAYIGL